MIDRQELIYVNIIEHKIRNLPDTRDLRLVRVDRSPSQYRIVHGRIARVSFGSGLWSNGRMKSSSRSAAAKETTRCTAFSYEYRDIRHRDARGAQREETGTNRVGQHGHPLNWEREKRLVREREDSSSLLGARAVASLRHQTSSLILLPACQAAI